MNAAGNADLIKREQYRASYTQLALILAAWALLSAVLLLTRALNRYGSISSREIFDAAALSSLIMFIATLVTESFLKVRARSATLLSSLLLVATYYARLFHIVSVGEGSVVLLPLVTVINFGKTGSGSITLDLGQLGLYAFLYFLIKNQSIKTLFRRVVRA